VILSIFARTAATNSPPSPPPNGRRGSDAVVPLMNTAPDSLTLVTSDDNLLKGKGYSKLANR
jgi:hypothetical protein